MSDPTMEDDAVPSVEYVSLTPSEDDPPPVKATEQLRHTPNSATMGSVPGDDIVTYHTYFVV